jgi:hypothetical protein
MDLIQRFQAWETLVSYNRRVDLQPKHNVGQMIRKRWGPRGRKGEYWLAMVVFYDPTPNMEDPTDGHYQIIYNDGHPDVIRDDAELIKLRWTPPAQVQAMRVKPSRAPRLILEPERPQTKRILVIQPGRKDWTPSFKTVFPHASVTTVTNATLPGITWPERYYDLVWAVAVPPAMHSHIASQQARLWVIVAPANANELQPVQAHITYRSHHLSIWTNARPATIDTLVDTSSSRQLIRMLACPPVGDTPGGGQVTE